MLLIRRHNRNNVVAGFDNGFVHEHIRRDGAVRDGNGFGTLFVVKAGNGFS